MKHVALLPDHWAKPKKGVISQMLLDKENTSGSPGASTRGRGIKEYYIAWLPLTIYYWIIDRIYTFY